MQLLHDPALADSIRFDKGMALGWAGDEMTAKSSAPVSIWNTLKPFQQKLATTGVIEVCSAKSGRVHARRPTESVYLESGVVGDRDTVRCLSVDLRLVERIVAKGLTMFIDLEIAQPHVAETNDVYASEKVTKFSQLARIACGYEQWHLRRSAFLPTVRFPAVDQSQRADADSNL
jgi:hypothetical protein